MNHTYRLVWSALNNAWIAVAETARSKGKGKNTSRRSLSHCSVVVKYPVSGRGLTWSFLLAAGLINISLSSIAGPVGGVVTAGAGNIMQSGMTTTVTQNSKNLSLNWQGFNVSAGETVNFSQPSTSAIAVNRISGGASQIYGNLNANGQVFLINPSGILFGKTAQVNVGGLVASTLDLISDPDSATKRFSGNSSGSIVNQGVINTASGGYAALLGNQVSNQGTITAKLGSVTLAAGNSVNLDFGGNTLFSVQVSKSAFDTLVENRGLIVSEGGVVTMTAGARDTLMASAVNNSGVIEARSVEDHGGKIVLSAGGAFGSTTVSGTLDASSQHGQGNTINVGGQSVYLTGATLDASGGAGGGVVNIGGGAHGQAVSDIVTADHVLIDKDSTIRVRSTTAGNGGEVTVWSEKSTQFDGSIDARAIGTSGDGGNAEVSSAGALAYRGVTNLLAANGKTGNLLLDPYNVTISGAADVNSSGFAASGTGSVINTGTLQTALGSANVTVSTGSAGAEAGNITVADPLQWAAATTLSLNAAGAIAINAPITATATGAGLNLSAGSGQTVSATDAINVNTFNLAQGNWSQNSITLPDFYAANFTRGATATFTRVAGGSGSVGAPYLIADIYGLQGIGSSATGLTSVFKLINNIDASSTSGWNAGSGFLPIGTSALPFTGTFNGNNYAVTNLFINRPLLTTGVGLFGYIQNGTVSNLSLYNVGVTGGSNGTGGIVGTAVGSSSLTGLVTTGSVNGANTAGVDNVGGIVGGIYNTTTITASSSAATVSGYGSSTGGAVGGANTTTTTIISTSATGTVTGSRSVGGLVGLNQGMVTDSYATGAVTQRSGGSAVGGLIGYQLGAGSATTRSYSSGLVTGTDTVGGFVGGNEGTVSASYWNTTINGATPGYGYNNGGNLATLNGAGTNAMQTQATFTGWDFTNTWYQTSGFTPTLRAGTTILGSAGGNLTVSTDPDSTSVINNTTLQNLLGVGSVLVNTGNGTLTVANAVSWGGARQLNLAASGALTINASANLSATAAGNLGLYSLAGPVSVTNATLSTVGGQFSILAPQTGTADAVTLSGVTVNVGAGVANINAGATTGTAVSLNGNNAFSANGAGSVNISAHITGTTGRGILFAENSALTTNGSVKLTGAADHATGISFCIVTCTGTALVTSASGNLTLTGTSNVSGSAGAGINMYGETLKNTGTGNFTLNATNSSDSTALYIANNALTMNNTGSGTLSLAGGSALHYGVFLANAVSLVSSGNVSLSGKTTAVNANTPSFFSSGTHTFTDNSGNLTIIGGTSMTSGVGFYGTGSLTLANNGTGAIAVNGLSSAANGISVAGGATFATVNSSSGQINLTGTGGTSSKDINIATTGDINFAAGSITGAGGRGISLISSGGTETFTSNTITTNNGSLVLSATSAGANNAITLNAGTISVGTGTGTVSGTATSNTGITLTGTNSFTASGVGSLTFNGTSSSVRGLLISSGASVTTNGSLNLTGNSSTSSGTSICTSGCATPVLITDQSGNLTLSGISTSYTGIDNYGETYTNAGSGNFFVTASAGGSGMYISGGTMVLNNTGTGLLSVSGTSGSARGLQFNSGSSLTSSGTVSVSGTSTGLTGIGFCTTTCPVTILINDLSGNLTMSGTSTSGTGFDNYGQTFTNVGNGVLAVSGTSSGGSGINLAGTTGLINSSTGSITYFGTSQTGNGIRVKAGIATESAGAVAISGNSVAASGTSPGILFTGSNTVTDDSGNLTINGGDGANKGIGISATGDMTLVNSGTGTLSLTGKSATANGIDVSGAAMITTSGTGTVNLTGATTSGAKDISIATTGNATFAAGTITGSNGKGVSIISSGGLISSTSNTITTNNGALQISATNAAALGNAVSINGGTINVGTGAGNIAGSVSTTNGVVFSGTNSITASGAGAVSVSGSANGVGGQGMLFNPGAGLTTDGTVTLTGNSVSTTGLGLCTAGCGSPVLITDHSGNLTLNGISTNATGLDIYGETVTNQGTGSLTLAGTSSNSGYGVYTNSATGNLVNSGSGSLNLNGASASGVGIYLNNNVTFNTTAAVNMNGVSTSGTGVISSGLNTFTDNAGNFALAGTSNSGVGTTFSANHTLTNSGAGTLIIQGTSTSGDGLDSTNTQQTTGSVRIAGSSGGAVGLNDGATYNVVSGTLTLQGNANSGTAIAETGVTIANNGTVALAGNSTSGTGIRYSGTNNYNSIGAAALAAAGNSQTGNGITFVSGTALTSSGTNVLTGKSTSASSTAASILLNGSNMITDSSGILRITGGDNSDKGIGVAATGNLTLTNNGTGSIELGGNSATATGIKVSGATTVTTSGTGAVNLTGAGVGSDISIAASGALTLGKGTLTGSNGAGISVVSTVGAVSLAATGFTTTNGALAITANNAGTASGVTLNGDAINVGTGTGAISGVTASASQYGVNFSGSNTVTSLGAGSVTFSGSGSAAGGIALNSVAGSTLTASGTTILMDAAGSAAATGINIDGTISSGAGSLTLAPASSGSLNIASGGSVKATGSGTLTLTTRNTGALTNNGTVALATGTGMLTSGGALTNAGVISSTGGQYSLVSGAGSDILLSSGSQITSSASGNAVILASGQNFVNNAGSAAINLTGGGRWLVYSNTPGADMFGSLNSNNTAIWNTTYVAGSPPAATGNRYIFAYQPVLTFNSTNLSKTYGGDATIAVAGAYSVSGLQVGTVGVYLGDSAASVWSGTPGVTSAGSAGSASVAGGPYAINVAAGSVSSLDGYALSYQSSGTLTVNPAALTITANNAAKTYDGVAYSGGNGVSYSGFVNGEAAAVLAGTTSYGGAAQGKINAGTYALSASGQTSGNYTITYEDGALTINKALLTVAANASNKIYDGSTAAAVTLSDNRVSGDVFTVSDTSAVFSDKKAGTGKAVTVSGIAISGAEAGNYTVNTTATTTADISQAALIIGATASNKVYDGSTAATIALSDNRIAGDALTITDTAAVFNNKNAGTGKAVNVSGIAVTGADAGNYTFNNTAATVADISPAALTLTGAAAGNKVYDSTTATTVTGGAFIGLVVGDTVNVTGATFADKNVGTGKAVTVGLAGADLANYSFSQPGLTANISQATLTVAATVSNKVYDGTTAATVALSDNRIAGDALTITDTAAAFNNKNTGTGKAVTVSGIAITGTDAGNYTFNNTATTTGDISQALLSLTGAAAGNKVYDGNTATTVTGGAFSGLVAGDNVTVTGGTFADKNAGTGKAVIVGLTGTDMANYSFTQPGLTANISQASLTLTGAAAGNKIYDGNTATTVTGGIFGGLIAGDNVTVNGSTFADKNAGAGKTVMVGLTGTDAANYSLAQPGLAADIAARALTITGESASNKVYDGTTTATVTGGTLNGLIAGNNVSVAGATFADQNAGAGKAIRLNLTGSDLTNYSFSQPVLSADIIKASLVVAVNNAHKTTDGQAYVGGNGVTYQGFVSGETTAVLNGTTTYGGTAQGAVSAGTYTLTAGGQSAANYALTYQPGSLTIVQSALAKTTDNAAKTYEEAAAGLTAYKGFVAGGLNSNDITVSPNNGLLRGQEKVWHAEATADQKQTVICNQRTRDLLGNLEAQSCKASNQ